MKDLEQKVTAALNKLTKWRSVFAGWQLGTRADTDPEARAVRDHREVTILLRAELNALTGALIKKGVITQEEFNIQLLEDAEHLDKTYERRFPGFKSCATGMEINIYIAKDTMQGWKP